MQALREAVQTYATRTLGQTADGALFGVALCLNYWIINLFNPFSKGSMHHDLTAHTMRGAISGLVFAKFRAIQRVQTTPTGICCFALVSEGVQYGITQVVRVVLGDSFVPAAPIIFFGAAGMVNGILTARKIRKGSIHHSQNDLTILFQHLKQNITRDRAWKVIARIEHLGKTLFQLDRGKAKVA